MNYIGEIFDRHLALNPEHAFVYDEQTPQGLSFIRIYELSGRVYAYLKAHGIGKEDFVLIRLPRGVQPVIAMLGVWRAGAAWVLVEDTYAPDRISFISKDCSCKIELDVNVWEEIQNTEPLAGYEDVDSHDAAYAVYTSGTTGSPKGVLHEHGNLREAVDSCTYEGKICSRDDVRFACPSPLSFVASTIITLLTFFLKEAKLFILSYATVKNPVKFSAFLRQNRISELFLTPSYARAMDLRTGYLTQLWVGSEPANTFDPGNLTVYNFYAMSETGFGVCVFRIDRPYDVCPVGHSPLDKRIYLIGEDGKETPDGEIGELCVDNPYVRGYINLKEQTESAFKNGIYHTGDLAKKLPDGNYVIVGRNSDMIKINGNRVEPGEVEAAVKAVLGINWCAVRGFEEEGGAFLAAYYTADIPDVDTKAVREALSRRLPYYMLPQYFVKIDKIPLKTNGKFDRRALPRPNTCDYVSDYVAPTNETEAALCRAMATVLKIDRVGINDDFYELGGDSLGSMQVIVMSKLSGLDAADIFRGRTPKAISDLYLASHPRGEGEKFDERNERAKRKTHKLTAEQTYMVDYQFYTPLSTMYNLFTMMKIGNGRIESQAFADAVNNVLQAHPVFGTVFSFNDDGDIVQTYSPDTVENVKVEKMSEFDFNMLKNDLVKPYKIIGNRLYRCRLFETEKALYLFFDVHHTIFDGTSFKVLIGDIEKALNGEPLGTDYYYLILDKREEEENSGRYLAAQKYFEETYNGEDWVTHPKTDHETRDNTLGDRELDLNISQQEMKAIEQTFGVSRNEFFISVYLLAIALDTEAMNIKTSWIYNGRDNVQSMSVCGLLYRDLPVAIRFRNNTDVRELYADVQAQVRKAIEHSSYPYNEKNVSVVTDDVSCILYQGDIRDGSTACKVFEHVGIRQNYAASQAVLDTEILDGAEGLKLSVHYAASRYDEETIDRFAGIFAKVCHTLVKHTEQTDLIFRQIRDAVLGRPSVIARLLWKR